MDSRRTPPGESHPANPPDEIPPGEFPPGEFQNPDPNPNPNPNGRGELTGGNSPGGI